MIKSLQKWHKNESIPYISNIYVGGQKPLTAFFLETYVTQLKIFSNEMARVNQKTFPHSSKQSIIIFIVHNYTI